MNQFLASLPEDVTRRLLRGSEKVHLNRGTVLHEPYQQPHYAYLPVTGVCSVVTRTRDGHAVETGMVGDEGCTGMAHLLGECAVPAQYIQQIAGVSLRIPYINLQTGFHESETLRRAILALVQAWTLSMGQLVACQRLHRSEQRLARWLLMARQRSRSDVFQLSHEFLAEMLGSGRPKVTMLLLEFREAGLVDSERNGLIAIRDVVGLEATACECHSITTRLYADLYTGFDGQSRAMSSASHV